MDGTILVSGIEIKALHVVALGITCGIFALSTIIFYVLWTKEVIRRKGEDEKLLKEIKDLLEDIKSSFGQEIFVAVDRVMETMDGIIPDLERGKCSVIFKDIIRKLLTGWFSENISLLCSGLDRLGMEIESRVAIKDIYSESDGAIIGNLISSISGSVKDIGAFVNAYKVKSLQDAIKQCYRRDEIIKSLQYNIEKLRQCVAGLKLNNSREE